MKGIVLAGGLGTRLYPATLVVSKQLLPIYDKPMIYYPLAALLLAGIRDILVITTPQDIGRFEGLLGNGSQWGVSISYAAQPEPRGLADAFLIGESFINSEPVALILGDNLFYGNKLSDLLQKAAEKKSGGTIFAYRVQNPKRYGVVAFDKFKKVKAIVEKPVDPPSSYAVTGLYFYDSQVVEIAKQLKPSARGELEITDVNNYYLSQGQLEVITFSRGMAWLDAGTFSSLLDASQFIEAIESRQGIKIACLEEIAFRMGYINLEELIEGVEAMNENAYSLYLKGVINECY